MGPPASGLRVHPTRAALVLLAALGAWALACAGPLVTAPAIPPAPAPQPGALRVRLVFADAADLDLYVTGPLLETVYYANTPSKIGGELANDERCDAPPGIRVETVTFAAAPPGRYRVGVDFPERCRLPARRVAFAVVVEGVGLHREHAGEIELGVFEPLVLEFAVDGQP